MLFVIRFHPDLGWGMKRFQCVRNLLSIRNYYFDFQCCHIFCILTMFGEIFSTFMIEGAVFLVNTRHSFWLCMTKKKARQGKNCSCWRTMGGKAAACLQAQGAEKTKPPLSFIYLPECGCLCHFCCCCGVLFKCWMERGALYHLLIMCASEKGVVCANQVC